MLFACSRIILQTFVSMVSPSGSLKHLYYSLCVFHTSKDFLGNIFSEPTVQWKEMLDRLGNWSGKPSQK